MAHRTIALALSSILACTLTVADLAEVRAQEASGAKPRPRVAAKASLTKSALSMGDPVGSFAPMLARVIPAVVTVRVTSEFVSPVEFKPGMTLPPATKIVSRSGGSGVIVDAANGYIVTNNHVIDGGVSIEVVLSDGRLLPARLVGRDIGTDLAVIEVAVRNLPQVPVGNSDAIRVGDVVAAVGNPFGLESTATLGIVSATMRTEVGHESFEDFLQTDAVINPGNSGGALVNVRGELIGINTAAAGAVGNVGIGFAIPINMARTVKNELIRHGKMQRGSPGLVVEDLSYERAAELMSGTNRGAVITSVIPGSPAAAAGLKPGAIITEVAGKPVRGAAEFNTRVVTVPVGTVLPIVVREDGKDHRYQLATAAIALTTREYTLPETFGPVAGLTVRDIVLGNPLYGNVRGSQVVRFAPDSPAARTGLQAGDVIVGIDEHNVRRTEHLYRFVDRVGPSYRVRLVRDDRPGWLRVAR